MEGGLVKGREGREGWIGGGVGGAGVWMREAGSRAGGGGVDNSSQLKPQRWRPGT